MRVPIPIGRIWPLILLLLAACQTVPPAPTGGFTDAQKQVLRDNGFEETGRGWEFGMADRLLFRTDESRIIADQAAQIARIAQALRQVGIARVRVEGHTDNTGQAGYNEALSLRRAQAVGDSLMRGGMPQDGIVVEGMGQRHPVESNRTAAGRAENRRVVIVVPTP